MDIGNYISLAEWAKRNGIDPSTARQKALRGGFKTARKIGRNWVIDEREENVDRRFKKGEKLMNRNEVLEKVIYKETGRVVSGEAIWEEIERAAGEVEAGEKWITGQDDLMEKWDYYVNIQRSYDDEYDQWDVSISLEEIKIEDKKTGKHVYIQVKGNEI